VNGTSVEVCASDDTVTNHASESGRWLKLMADIEHEPAPEQNTRTASADSRGAQATGSSKGLCADAVRVPYTDIARARQVYELGGFGGPYSPPSGILEP
jgi:hypothetical protein